MTIYNKTFALIGFILFMVGVGLDYLVSNHRPYNFIFLIEHYDERGLNGFT